MVESFVLSLLMRSMAALRAGLVWNGLADGGGFPTCTLRSAGREGSSVTSRCVRRLTTAEMHARERPDHSINEEIEYPAAWYRRSVRTTSGCSFVMPAYCLPAAYFLSPFYQLLATDWADVCEREGNPQPILEGSRVGSGSV